MHSHYYPVKPMVNTVSSSYRDGNVCQCISISHSSYLDTVKNIS